MESSDGGPRELKGIPAAPGLARGVAFRWEHKPIVLPSSRPTDPETEIARLEEARHTAKAQLDVLAKQVRQRATSTEAALLEAQAMFIDDPALLDRVEAAIRSGQSAEKAWHEAIEHFALQLESLQDETLRARAADIRDVGRRVLEVLLGASPMPLLQERCVVIARDLAPSQTATLDTSKVVAFCTAEGGPTSHTAILARALGIPAVVGLGEDLLQVPDGSPLLVDGMAGRVIVKPDEELIMVFQDRVEENQSKHLEAMIRAHESAVTRDGHRVEVVANVGNLDEAREALDYGAEGIGLLRTEFLFLNRRNAPTEEEQYLAYREIFEIMQNRPVVIRTLDIGGDKEVPYYSFGMEANPFLGYRAIRVSLDHPEDFKTQLRALLRAGVGHNLRIMFPMVATLEEIRQARALLEAACQEVKERGLEAASGFQTGIMVEVPSAALMADRFAPEVDFFSIGTNDLTQYTLAAERGNKRVAYLNDACHPAVLRLIRMVTEAARRYGRWVGVCGEMAGDADAIPILLGLGLDELSMAVPLIPHVKAIIRKWSLKKAQELADLALDLASADEVRALVRRFEPT